MSITIITKTRAAPITKTHACCLLVYLPARQVMHKGLFLREVPAHWERVTSDGRVVRCHTELEAQEAAALLYDGIEQGQWLGVSYDTGYMPQDNDLPYYEWVRGIRGNMMRHFGIRSTDLPETQDPSLEAMSDQEWLLRGPR